MTYFIGVKRSLCFARKRSIRVELLWQHPVENAVALQDEVVGGSQNMQADKRVERPGQRLMNLSGGMGERLVLRQRRQGDETEIIDRMVAGGGRNIAANRHG